MYTNSADEKYKGDTPVSHTMGSGHSTLDAELLSHLRHAMEMRNPLERYDTQQPAGFADAEGKMAEENKRACLLTQLSLPEPTSPAQQKWQDGVSYEKEELPFSSGWNK